MDYRCRSTVIAEARSWIGTPFHRQQHKKGQGCDCISFAIEVLRATGFPPAVNFEYPVGYRPLAIDDSIKNYCDVHLEKITPAQALPGDIALVTWGRLHPTHVGILGNYMHLHLTPPLSIIHAMIIPGKVCEHHYGEPWPKNTVQLYRIPGIG